MPASLEHIHADTPMALLMHHARTPADPPSSRTELPIPGALDDLVLACLAKDPACRPQTARELAARLAAIPFPESWNEERAREWWEKHRPVEPAAAAPTQLRSG